MKKQILKNRFLMAFNLMLLAFLAALLTLLLAPFNFAQPRSSEKAPAQPSFDPARRLNGQVYATVLQSDGRMVEGSNFTAFGGVEHNRIIRLHADGSLDTSYQFD